MPKIVFIASGNLVVHDGTTYRIRRLASDNNSVICEHVTTNAIKAIPLSELNEQLPSTEQDSGSDILPPMIAYSKEQQEKAEQRYKIIAPFLDGPVDPEKLKQVAVEKGIGRSTIYKWRRLFSKTKSKTALVDREGRGGKNVWRLSDAVNKIIDECIELHYKNGKKSVNRTMTEIKLLCDEKQLKVPNVNTIKNRIKAMPESELARARRGKKKASEIFGAKTGTIPGAEFPFRMVMIDHTKLDLVLVDEEYRMVLGRPWLTLLIDVCTRIPLGFYISLDPPGNFGTGQAIAMALYTKDKILSKYKIDAEWPVWGPIQTLHCDNAGEFHSEMMKQSCGDYGINLQYRQIGKPHYGSHIERLLGTFAKEIHDLPGTTFSNPQDRKYFDYDSEKLAAFTLEEIEEYLLVFITKVYMNRIHKGLGMAPIIRFKQFQNGDGGVLPTGIQPFYPDEDRLKLDFLPFVERTIQTYGVEIDNQRYYSSVLSEFINAKEETEFVKTRRKRKFIFKINPNNLNRAYFLHPVSKDYYQIPQSGLDAPPISKWEKRAIEKQLKAEGKEINENEIIAGYKRLKHIEETAQAKTKKARRNKHRQNIAGPKVVELGVQEQTVSNQKSKVIDYSILNSLELDHETFS